MQESNRTRKEQQHEPRHTAALALSTAAQLPVIIGLCANGIEITLLIKKKHYTRLYYLRRMDYEDQERTGEDPNAIHMVTDDDNTAHSHGGYSSGEDSEQPSKNSPRGVETPHNYD